MIRARRGVAFRSASPFAAPPSALAAGAEDPATEAAGPGRPSADRLVEGRALTDDQDRPTGPGHRRVQELAAGQRACGRRQRDEDVVVLGSLTLVDGQGEGQVEVTAQGVDAKAFPPAVPGEGGPEVVALAGALDAAHHHAGVAIPKASGVVVGSHDD